MFYGLDVHKEFIQVCELRSRGDQRQEYRIGAAPEEVREFAEGLGPRDQVALEATFHTWALHAILSAHAGRVVVANPLQVKAIAHARIKTDKVDAYTLARLLRADFLPTVELPDARTWALRQLVSQRQLLVKQRTAIKNTIRGLLNRALIRLPQGEPFSGKGRTWMRQLELPDVERFLLHNVLDLLGDLDTRVTSLEQRMREVAAGTPEVRLLLTIPGVGITVALGLLAAIGDVRRFPTPGHLSAYLGLVPRVRQSAGRCHHGRITKTGSSSARHLAIEAAQVLARSPSPITATYFRVRRKRGHNVAVTALARKLVVLIWHLLQKGEPYRYVDPALARRKLRQLRAPALRPEPKATTLEEVYAGAQLPPLPDASPAERRAAANNRRSRTRLASR